MNHPLRSLALWIALCSSLLRGGIAVTEDGPQLAYVESLHRLTLQIQSDQALSQEHLAKLRAMEEGSKQVALAMVQINSLLKQGQLLTQDPNGSDQSASKNGLSYDGASFQGGNYDFIDNLMGQNGPIALDRVPPVTLVPVSGALLTQARQAAANFAAQAGGQVHGPLVSLLSSMLPTRSSANAGLLSQLAGKFLAGSGATGMLADGVFVRPYAGRADDAYQALVQNGGPTEKALFFANPSLGGSGYQALLGPTQNPQLNMVDMDGLLSAGASQAVQAYALSNSSSVANPYQGYASHLLSQLPTLLHQTAPGTAVVPGSAGDGAGAPDLSFPSLFAGYAAPSAGPELVGASPFGFSSPTGPSDTAERGVVVVTPPAAEAQAYQSKISENDEQLRVVSSEMKTQEQTQQYQRQIVQGLLEIQQEVQSLQTTLNNTAVTSIPELTALERDVQADIETRQHEEALLSVSIEKLQQELHRALVDRATIVEMEAKTEAVRALPRWRSALGSSETVGD